MTRFNRLMQAIAVSSSLLAASGAGAQNAQVERGKYLVRLGGCGDCHTPGYLLGAPDPNRTLAGSDVGFRTPVGTFVGANLTPDRETGLGSWTREEIITAMQTGVRPDGRILSDIMPWRALSGLTRQDAVAIATYLQSIPAVNHKVSGPIGPGEEPNFKHFTLVDPASRHP